MITLKIALQQMEQRDEKGMPVLFDIEYCKYSRSKKEGGQIVKLESVFLSKILDRVDEPPRELQSKQAVREGRQPSHFKNKTRNVILPNGETRKFRIRMLLKFNGLTVVY